jgi:hypothetical protein
MSDSSTVKWARFKTAFGVVDSELLVERRNKINDALAILEAQTTRLVTQDALHLIKLDAQLQALRTSCEAAFGLNDNAQSRKALEAVKDEARQAGKAAIKTVDDFLKEWSILDEQRTKAKYFIKIAGRVKVGEPLEWLVRPTEEIILAVNQVEEMKTKDAQTALTQWRRAWGSFDTKFVTKYKEEVLQQPLIDQDDMLQRRAPDGPEAKMAKAFRARYVDALVNMKLTALSNGVDIDKLGISLGEALAVSEYTSGAYKDINGMLLKIPNEARKPDREDVCNITIGVLTKGMVNLPSWRSWPVSRGENAFRGWEKQYERGNTFSLKAFWSTGCGFAFDGTIQITISGKSDKSAGKDVSALSQHPNEQEILFPPGTKFTVTNCTEKNGVTLVSLKEV